MPFAKGQHPRLFFSAEDLPSLRARANSGVRRQAMQVILRWADRLLDPTHPDHFDIATRQREIWKQRASIFTWRAAMSFLTWAYVLSGERRYGEAARDALMITIQDKLADQRFPAEGADHDGWRRSRMHQHDKGNYAVTICTVYDCCYDLFSDEQRRRFIEHALESYQVFMDPAVRERDRVFIFNNRGARAFTGCAGFYPLTLEGDVEIAAPMHAPAERFLMVAWDADGYPAEGLGYGGVLGEMFLFAHALARSGRDDLRRLPAFEQAIHSMLYQTLPWGGDCNNLNDTERNCGGAMPFIGVMSRPAGAIVPWLLQRVDLHPDRIRHCDTSIVEAYYRGPWIMAALFWDDAIPLKTPEELGYPVSHCFLRSGVAAMRTGWGDDDLLLVHRAGPCVPQMHNQSDQNHLALYARGERFLIDEGYGDRIKHWPSDVPPPPARYYGYTQAHNSVVIDGQSQNGTIMDGRTAQGIFRQWFSGSDWDTTLGDARAAYGNQRVIDEAARRVVLVRRAPLPYLVVIDTAAVDATGTPHTFDVLWRTDTGNRIDTQGPRATIVGRQADCHGEVLYSSAPADMVVQEHLLALQWRVRVTGSRLEMVTVWCPTPRGQPAPRFTCARQPDGRFAVTMEHAGVRQTVLAGTQLAGPLRQAALPQVTTQTIGG
jgi:hypothetical protein